MAGALGVFCGVKKRGNSFPLIGLKDSSANGRVENSPHEQNPRQGKHRRMLPLQAGQKGSNKKHRDQHGRCTQIGLLKNKDEWSTSEQSALNRIRWVN